MTDTEMLDYLQDEARKGGAAAETVADLVMRSAHKSLREVVREHLLDELLAIIRGQRFPFSPGITTWPGDVTLSATRLHGGCLELEHRGLIERHYQDGPLVVWRAVERKAA